MKNNMKTKLSKQKPVLTSILWALLILAFYILGGVITQVNKMNAANTKLVDGLCIWGAVLTAIIYIWKSNYTFAEIGFKHIEKGTIPIALYFLPAAVMEIIGFTVGFNFNIKYLFATIFCTVAVGFAEEIYFRGIIFKTLEIKGIKKAIIISSAIFGVMHAGNIVGGADIFYTCIQIVFAFAFGIVFVEIFYFTKSLIPIIIWHFVHDCLTYIENTPTTQTTIILGGIQTLILVIYAVYMWRKIGKECNQAVSTNF